MSDVRIVKLGDICDISMGQAPPGDSYNQEEIGMPLIAGAGDFKNGVIIPSKYTKKPTKICSAGDIILSIRASIGPKVLADKEYCLGRGVAGIRVNSNVNLRYLWHWLTYITPQLISRARGATFVQISRKDISDIQLALPHYDEQTRISRILDNLTLIQKGRERQLAALDELSYSIFIDSFGSPNEWSKKYLMTTIGDIAVSTQYGTSAKSGDTGKYPVLRMGNITDHGHLDLTDLKYQDIKESEIPKYTVAINDMLFNRTNSKEKVGKSAVIRTDIPLAYAGYLIRVRYKNPRYAEFVATYLNSTYGKSLRQKMAKSAVNQANINATELKNISIPNIPKEALSNFSHKINISCNLPVLPVQMPMKRLLN